MPSRLEFFFDYSCPFAYLASTQVEVLARALGKELDFRPILLGGIFRANDVPQKLFAAQVAPKAANNLLDMGRWAELYGVTLRMPPNHPIRTVEALRATLATGCDPKVIHAFYRAYWVDGLAISEPDVIRSVLTPLGHDAAAILTRIEAEGAKAELRERTDAALGLGIFGVPVFRVDDGPIFWGQDRMSAVSGIPWSQLVPRGADAVATRPHTLELYWDFSSPFAYLGYMQAAELARRTGATLVQRPMLLGALFKQVGQPQVPLVTWSPSKQAYYFQDMQRSAALAGVPFTFPSRFPMNSLKALRAYLALPEERRDAFARATFAAYWAEDRDIADDAVLASLLGDGADDVLARTQTPAIKQALADATSRAVTAGVFGAPAWVVDGQELFWGNDRLVLVERALRV